jgi:Domain of unknown function (DUF4189)
MTKHSRRLLFALLCLAVSLQAAAQGCPPGQYPVAGQGWNYCAPVPGAAQEEAQPARQNQFKWRNHWQATATDNDAGVLGTSVGQSSADAAEKKALIDCRSKGGKKCEVEISYMNGCVAMAVGEKQAATNGGLTKDEAIRKALAICGKGDSTCQPYYSSCDLPDRVPAQSIE